MNVYLHVGVTNSLTWISFTLINDTLAKLLTALVRLNKNAFESAKFMCFPFGSVGKYHKDTKEHNSKQVLCYAGSHLRISHYECTVVLKVIECIHMTSRRPCWRSKQRNGGHVGGAKHSFWGLNSIFMQIPSFVSLCKCDFWSHEGSQSIEEL